MNSDLEWCMAVLGGLKATAGMNEGARNRLAVDAVCCASPQGMSKRVEVELSGAPIWVYYEGEDNGDNTREES